MMSTVSSKMNLDKLVFYNAVFFCNDRISQSVKPAGVVNDSLFLPENIIEFSLKHTSL